MPFTVDPLWRFLVTDLSGAGLTLLDKLASERTVTPTLNDPSQITGTVPSDNPEVNRLHTDGYPFVAEGVRQLYCFRRESDVVPNWIIRATGLMLQVGDAAASDDARTRFTAFDPWQYLYYLPCCVPGGELGEAGLLGPEGFTYPDGTSGSEIIEDLIDNWLDYWDANFPTAPASTRQFFTNIGDIEATAPFTNGYKIEGGQSMGQVFADLAATGTLDIIFSPFYDSTQPGIMSELFVYSQAPPGIGAGVFNWAAIFAWDRPGRSLVGADDFFDGTQRANAINMFNGQGGPSVGVQLNPDSIDIYGPYFAQQFFPAQTQKQAVIAIAQEQLALRSLYKQTLTVNPATLRAPSPFTDYGLGDRVPVYASNRMRQEITGFQRIFGIPISIDDNGVETVNQLIVGPAGAPPPVAPFAKLGTGESSGAAIGAGERGRRGATSAVLSRPTVVNP